ncbi:hypothetical protein BP6252_13704 [Coleophoma cylindrospora]|uniref:Uncharacterized protein n=1 Tax=Coleophoma cylindrospora TaxID=1849047 RepID=A0A3D8Q708_9HELO|nr:hypothetical protein BP6252_13704 [Coleophoma cylindrospora]
MALLKNIFLVALSIVPASVQAAQIGRGISLGSTPPGVCKNNPIVKMVADVPVIGPDAISYCSSFLHVQTATATITVTHTQGQKRAVATKLAASTPAIFQNLAAAAVSTVCSCLPVPTPMVTETARVDIQL